MLRLHHVNLGVPEDGLEAETDFLVGVIGMRHLTGDDTPPQANWFEADSGVQIHVSRDPNHHAPDRAHVAFEFGPGLAGVEERLKERGIACEGGDRESERIVVCRDPAGNRWELRGALAGK